MANEMSYQQLLDEVLELRRHSEELDKLREEHAQWEGKLEQNRNYAESAENELRTVNESLQEAKERVDKLEEETTLLKLALSETENHYRNLMANVPIMLSVRDIPNEQDVFWNKPFGWSGHTIEEWNDLKPEEQEGLIHHDDLEEYLQRYNEWEAEGCSEPLSREFRIKDKALQYHWIESVVFREFGSDGRLLVQIEMSDDVSASRRLARMKTDQSSLYDMLSEIQTDLICRTDPYGKALYVSPSYCEAFGMSEAELLGETLIPETLEEDSEIAQKAEEDLTRPPHECYYEQQTKTAKGWRWISWSRKACLDGKGAIDSIIGLGRDITALKRTESALKASQHDILRFFDELDEYVFVHDLKGEIYYMNPPMTADLGYSIDNPPPEQLYSLFPEDQSDKVDSMLVERKEGEVTRYQVPLLNNASETVDVTTVAAPINWNEKQVIINLSRRLRDPRAETPETAALEEDAAPSELVISGDPNQVMNVKTETISRFASGVAHHVSNLLTVINGHAQSLTSMVKPSSPAAHNLETISRTSVKGALLTRKLLTIAGRHADKAKVIDLNALIQESDSLLRRLLGDKIVLQTNLTPAPCMVKVDPEQIQLVLMNLTDNVLDSSVEAKAMTIKTRQLESIRLKEMGFDGGSPHGYVMLMVSDDGKGMSDDVLMRAFDPYFTTKDRSESDGLGLSIVQGVVRQSKGQIRLKSTPGEGTQVEIFLPLHGMTDIGTEFDDSVEARTKGAKSILIVEDETSVRELAGNLLRRQGFDVSESGDGSAAFTMCEHRDEPFDLLITDVEIPGIKGTELAEKIHRMWPNTEIIFMSGYTAGLSTEELSVGEIHFLQKPFKPTELISMVQSLLE